MVVKSEVTPIIGEGKTATVAIAVSEQPLTPVTVTVYVVVTDGDTVREEAVLPPGLQEYV